MMHVSPGVSSGGVVGDETAIRTKGFAHADKGNPKKAAISHINETKNVHGEKHWTSILMNH